MLKKKIFHILLLLLLIADIDYSFRQHEHKTLDGDMALITAPSKNYTPILQEPFGIKAAIHHEQYAGSNRYFVHKAMVIYYKQLYPYLSAVFPDKIDALYKITGLFHTIIQILIILLIAFYAVHKINYNSIQYLLLLVLLAALCQTHGYNASIGIIDHSVTYTFFYAMPLAGLMLFLIPFLRWNTEHKSTLFKVFFVMTWSVFGYMLSMTGALIAPLGIIISGVIIAYMFAAKQRWISKDQPDPLRLPLHLWIVLCLFVISCLYSYYVGTFNLESAEAVPLSYRYGCLLQGLKHYFVQNISFLLLAIILLVNLVLLRKNKIKIPFYAWIMLALSVIYILMLPLGGYRSYRPEIIRNDTFLPVTLVLLYSVARSTMTVMCEVPFNKAYVVLMCIIAGIFTYADKPYFTENKCQVAQIKRLQGSVQEVTTLPSDCPILTWDCTKDLQWTKEASEMLYYWQITDSIRLYKHE